jgi:uracil-DNA glycosylase
MDSAADSSTVRALLEWQVALGADEAILDAPLNRYGLADEPLRTAPNRGALPATAAAPPPETPMAKGAALTLALAAARASAAAAADLAALHAAMAAYPHCDLRQGARTTVFADGQPTARVMIVGEAPGREEDVEGRPFVGKAGQLLDRMLAAIGLSRMAPDPADAVYITNVLPWRPPANRAPEPDEIAMLLPFLERHIRLVDPQFLLLMGNTPCQALLGRSGITKLRGQWVDVLGIPALPMVHPAYLLRQSAAKREAWADLLALKSRLIERP